MFVQHYALLFLSLRHEASLTLGKIADFLIN